MLADEEGPEVSGMIVSGGSVSSSSASLTAVSHDQKVIG